MSDECVKWIIEEFNQYNQFSEISIEKIVDIEEGYAYKLVEFLNSKNLKSSQLTKIFEVIKKIERSDKSWNDKKIAFYLLKPRLAMGVGRSLIPIELYDVIITAMGLMDVSDTESENLKNFEYFVYFFESIMAYNKFLGGQ